MKKIILIFCSSLLISCNYNLDYDLANDEIEKGNFKKAVIYLNDIKEDNEFYAKSQKLIDSLNLLIQKHKLDSINNRINEQLKLIEINIEKINNDQITSIEVYDFIEVIANDSINFKDENLAKKSELLKKKIVSSKNKNMPKFRKEFYKEIKNKLWRDNIEVTLSNNTKTLNFSGGFFASNANIEDFVKTLSPTFKKLQFKRATFRWYKGADEYQYYDFN